jgi:hypothetical protein
MADAKHPLAGYAAHGLTTTQRRYLDWLKDRTGVQVDELSFKLAVALRDQFAKSPENKAYLKKRREEREAAQAAVDEVRRLREASEARVATAAEREIARAEAKADRLGNTAETDGVLEEPESNGEADVDDDTASLFGDDPYEAETAPGFGVPAARPPVHAPAFSDGGGRARVAAEPY